MHPGRVVLRLLLLAIALNCPTPSKAQVNEVVTVPEISPKDLPQAWQTIFGTPPSFALIPHSPQSHRGNVWLRSAENGLHIWGKVEAAEEGFHWPQQKSEILSSDHIEVWLAASSNVPMPDIGWGNQFGTTELHSAKDCSGQSDPHTNDTASGVKNCERWYNEQLRYRQDLRRLFVRQWLIAGTRYSSQTHSFEDFASTAYADLEAKVFPEDLPTSLKPEKEDNTLVAEIGAETQPETYQDATGRSHTRNRQTGYHFHVFVPDTAFPPTQQLKLADLYVMVDVFSSASAGQKNGDYSSTSPRRQWGNVLSFNHLRLASPRILSVAPCGYNLEQADLYGKSHPAWFFPTEPTLRFTFALINPAQGYLYEPGGVSPEIDDSEYFWKPLTNGAVICGPKLVWRQGTTSKPSKFTVDKEYFQSMALPDGWSLVRSGPSTSTLSTFGSGQCGACPVMDFEMYAVSPQGDITQALSLDEILSGTGEQASAADLTIAPDWKQIILYREFEESWNSTSYCLDSHAYKKCGEAKNVQPPNPPHFKELRGIE